MEIRVNTLSFIILLIHQRSDASPAPEPEKPIAAGPGNRFPRAVKAPLITPLQYYYMTKYYNPFWYGGPLDGGDTFDGPFGGFGPNPFARPTAKPKSDKSTTSKPENDASKYPKTTERSSFPALVAPTPRATLPYASGYSRSYEFEEHDPESYYPWNEYTQVDPYS